MSEHQHPKKADVPNSKATVQVLKARASEPWAPVLRSCFSVTSGESNLLTVNFCLFFQKLKRSPGHPLAARWLATATPMASSSSWDIAIML